MAYEIQLGEKSPKVLSFQKMLNVWLQHWGKQTLTPDGDFGKLTLAAVADFQRNNALPNENGVTPRCWDLVEGFANKKQQENEVPSDKIITVKRYSSETYSGFKAHQFDCKCGGKYCSTTKIDLRTLALLRKLFDHFSGRNITITSAYRCPTHNRNVGGVSNSRHAIGDAVDVVVDGVLPSHVATIAEEIGFDGVGIYSSGFVHLDTRGYVARW